MSFLKLERVVVYNETTKAINTKTTSKYVFTMYSISEDDYNFLKPFIKNGSDSNTNYFPFSVKNIVAAGNTNKMEGFDFSYCFRGRVPFVDGKLKFGRLTPHETFIHYKRLLENTPYAIITKTKNLAYQSVSNDEPTE